MQHQDRIQYLSHLLKHITDERTPDQLLRQLRIDLDPYDRTQLIKTLGLAAFAIQCRTEAEAQYARQVASFRNSPPSQEYCMSLSSMNRPGCHQPKATIVGWASHPLGRRAFPRRTATSRLELYGGPRPMYPRQTVGASRPLTCRYRVDAVPGFSGRTGIGVYRPDHVRCYLCYCAIYSELGGEWTCDGRLWANSPRSRGRNGIATLLDPHNGHE